jgi:MFS family permease
LVILRRIMQAGIPGPFGTVVCLGIVQILAWGSSFYFPAVFAPTIVAKTGWPLTWVVGGVSLGLLVGGVISPKVGAVIARQGGRRVIAASSLMFAAGLAGIGLAPSLPFYIAAWLLVGLGMGTGLYDAVFAALGRRYGQSARSAITNLTLFGGFASTVCWPLSAFLIEQTGWRNACLIYAALHLVVALPLQLYALRGHDTAPPPDSQPQPQAEDKAALVPEPASTARHEAQILILLALILSIASGIGSVVVVHLLIFLQAAGLDFTSAVALGTLFGPAQVAARVVESLFGRRYHPLVTLTFAIGLMALGLVLLLAGWVGLMLAVLLYAAGYGISWIARGTVPLALFGAVRFPVMMGRIAMPSLIVQALAPAAGAFAIDRFGTQTAIAILTALAFVNVALMIALSWRARSGEMRA